MSYRRRDAGRGGYSSADAYRSLHNPGNTGVTFMPELTSPPPPSLLSTHPRFPSTAHSSSSEEETALTGGRSDSPPPDNFTLDEAQLTPPKPFFLVAGRRDSSDSRSMSSAGDTPDPTSDSDTAGTDRESQFNRAGVGRRRMMEFTPGSAPSRRRGTAGSSSSHGRVQGTTSGVAGPRLHRRGSSGATTPVAVPASPSSSSHGHGSTNTNHASIGAGSQHQPPSPSNPFDTPMHTPVVSSPSASAIALAERERPTRGAPPSAFPFLSHVGNPDPGTPIPLAGSLARRPSQESFRRSQQFVQQATQPNTPGYPVSPPSNGQGYSQVRTSMDVHDDDPALGRPNAPFMGDGIDPRQSWVSNNGVYRNSAAAAITGSNPTLPGDGTIPRTNSQPQIAMRAPFLSPASRPSSSLWSPPSYPSFPVVAGQPLTSQYPPSLTYLPGGSNPHLVPRKARAPMPSSRLSQKLSVEDKPWIKEKESRLRWSWWLTFLMCWIGVGASAIVIFFGWTGVHQLLDSDLCLVLDEEFNSGSLDSSVWSKDVEMGGFGNGEFQMTTDDDRNLQVKNGQLYLIPTLTTDDLGFTQDQIIGKNPTSYTLDNCSVGKSTVSDTSGQGNCSVTSGDHDAIPPVRSARLSTKGTKGITFGKVEVRAKLPRGDWLWPAIWMLPEDNHYGSWPFSGEIDIMEARGNGQEYAAQGVNYVRSSLDYGVLLTLQTNLIGWWQEKRYTYAEDFHTYAMEWTPDWMRFYVDSRLQATMNVKITGKGGKSFFDRAGYPATAHNNSDSVIAVPNIWEEAGGSPAAPFDQKFYLILDLAAGGTSGWFPDNVGGKPWLDNSQNAMQAFAEHQDDWSKTWPSNENDRAFRIDSVKMWSLKQHGQCVAQ